MINFSRVMILGGLLAVGPLWAVYAPIPEQDQGKNLVFSVRSGLSHDSNVFGAAKDEVSSVIWSFAPRASYNASLTDQSFVSASYGLALDYFASRPGDKLLDSHEGSLRFAHAFSQRSTIDLYDAFTVSRNPESLLSGVPVNVDQSFTRNQLDGRFTTPLNAKLTATVKARSLYYHFRSESLGRALDRIENLYGVSMDYAFLPETKIVGEFRHQDVFYRKEGELKNKSSNYLMAGVDYLVAQRVSLSGRFGAEWRDRAAERDATSPYVELSGKYDYRQHSFLVGGYAYTIEEASDTLRFTDTRLHRFFLNVQHSITALIVGSASATYEPARLQGRRLERSISEDTFRAGTAVSYLPTRNWTISLNLDFDRVKSDDVSRNLQRERLGLSAMYSF